MRREKSFSRRNSLLLIVLAVFAMPLAVYGQDLQSGPSWILFEKGQRSYREGDFGGALTLFQQAAEKEAVYPEAEFWIGLIYEKEGQPELAERQYLKALEMSRALYVPEDRFTILYQLSDLYKTDGRLNDYEETLLLILDEELSSDPARIRNELAWSSSLTNQGLDKLLYLYRLELTYSLRASAELGVFYYKRKDYRSALIKNLIAVMSGYTVAINAILKENPDFEFPQTQQDLMALDEEYYYQSLDNAFRPFSGGMYVLDTSVRNKSVSRFLSDSAFYESFYYLGLSLYALGYKEESQNVLNILRNTDSAGVWKKRAAARYAEPGVESSEIIY